MYYKNFFLHVVCSQETAMAPSTRSGTVAKTSGSARKRTTDSLRVRLTAQQIMRLAPQHSTRPPQPLTSQQLLTPQQPSTDSESFQQICKGARPKPVTVEEVATNNNFTALPSPPPTHPAGNDNGDNTKDKYSLLQYSPYCGQDSGTISYFHQRNLKIVN